MANRPPLAVPGDAAAASENEQVFARTGKRRRRILPAPGGLPTEVPATADAGILTCEEAGAELLADGEGRSRVNPVVPGDGADADAVDLSAFKVALPRPARDVRLAGEACVLAWLEGREQLGVRSHALRLWGEATEQSPKVGVRVVRTVAAVENIMRCLDHLLTAAGRGAMGECLQPGFPLARLTHAVLRWLSVILDEFEIYTREHTFDGEPWGAAGRSFAEYSAAYVLASIRPTLDGLSEWTSKEPLDSRETPTAYPRKPSDARMAALWLEDALVHMDGELRISMT